jgi:alkylated DNA repair protein (DNA oxidative demethylase)
VLRLPAVAVRPEGLAYEPDFVTEDEERALVGLFEQLAFSEVVMHGQAAKRTVLHFGYRYDYDAWRLAPVEPLPVDVHWLRDRCGAFAGVDPERLVETLVSRYPAGAGIGWHRDAPMFGPAVIGVSLLAACVMRFQRRTPTVRETHTLALAPRSVYALTGAVRSAWQHSIASTPSLRYSVTFRTLARR